MAAAADSEGRRGAPGRTPTMRMRAQDRECVERVLAGESGAFEELVRKYHRLGGAIAFGVLGDFQLAEDVVQEAFFSAYRRLESLADPAKFRVWFAGIVRKRSIDVLRQRRSAIARAASLDAGADGPGGGAGSRNHRGGSSAGSRSGAMSIARDARRPDSAAQEPALERLARSEERRRVLECVGELAEEDRTVIVLKHMDGLSYKEIAEVTGWTVPAIESRLFRARQVLKRRLERLLGGEPGG